MGFAQTLQLGLFLSYGNEQNLLSPPSFFNSPCLVTPPITHPYFLSWDQTVVSGSTASVNVLIFQDTHTGSAGQVTQWMVTIATILPG